jgi:hypothetical protein
MIMNILKVISVSVLALSLTFTGLAGTSYAAGSASLSLSPNGGSYTVGQTFPVTISENSGADSVNTIEADLTFSPSLQLAGISCNTSAFEISAPESNGVTCATTSPKSGGQAVALARLILALLPAHTFIVQPITLMFGVALQPLVVIH